MPEIQHFGRCRLAAGEPYSERDRGRVRPAARGVVLEIQIRRADEHFAADLQEHGFRKVRRHPSPICHASGRRPGKLSGLGTTRVLGAILRQERKLADVLRVLRLTHHAAPSRAATDRSLGEAPRECLPRVKPVPPLRHQAWWTGASRVNLRETRPVRRARRSSRLPHPPLHCGEVASPRRVYSRVRPSTRAFICEVGRRPSSFVRRRRYR